MRYLNDAEGVSSGTAVDTTNSGVGGNAAFTTVTPGSGTLQYSTAQTMHGTSSIRVTATSAGPFFYWGSNIIPAGFKTMYARMYLYFTTVPTNSRFFQFTNSSIQLQGGVGTNGSGKFVLRDSAGTIVSTSSTSVPTNAWCRVEFYMFSDASVGQIECKIFLTPDSTSADETITTTATQNTRGDDIQSAIFGLPTVVASADFYMDDLGIQETGYFGPATDVPNVVTEAITNITASGATGAGIVYGDNNSTITERGVCWNTTGNPTTSDSKATAAGTTGSYTAPLSSLSNNTTYYVRAYATNGIGTGYGSQVSFTHQSNALAWIGA